MRTLSGAFLFSCFIFVSAFSYGAERAFVIDHDDYNTEIGTQSEFIMYENYEMGGTGLLPFDASAGAWDFSAFSSGSIAAVQTIDPASAPGHTHFPGATGCTLSEIPGQDDIYSFELLTTAALYWQGFYSSVFGLDIVADYQPDAEVYRFPMQVGTTWYTSYQYQYSIGITVMVSETHQTEVVAEGKVKVPGIAYWMPCLVLRTYHTYSDNLGFSDNYWLYEWVVPNGFSGANGVAALSSHKNASQDFSFCRNAFFLGTTNLTPDPAADPLSADVYEVKETGGTVTFALEAGLARAGRKYVLLGCMSGTSPGYPLPGGLVTLPLNWDLFTTAMIPALNTTVFQDFLGQLDGQGRGTAYLNVPPIPPGYVGLFMYYAYTLLNPFDFVSNPVAIEIVP
jgi:hypothetical protein